MTHYYNVPNDNDIFMERLSEESDDDYITSLRSPGVEEINNSFESATYNHNPNNEHEGENEKELEEILKRIQNYAETKHERFSKLQAKNLKSIETDIRSLRGKCEELTFKATSLYPAENNTENTNIVNELQNITSQIFRIETKCVEMQNRRCHDEALPDKKNTKKCVIM